MRLASTVEYELTGLITELGRDDAISGRHAVELGLSLPDRPELDRAQLFVGVALETPYAGYEKDPAAFFTVGVMYWEGFMERAQLGETEIEAPAIVDDPQSAGQESPRTID